MNMNSSDNWDQSCSFQDCSDQLVFLAAATVTCSDVKAAFAGVYQSTPIAELNAMSDAEFQKCIDVFGVTTSWDVDHLAALKTKLKSVRKTHTFSNVRGRAS